MQLICTLSLPLSVILVRAKLSYIRPFISFLSHLSMVPGTPNCLLESIPINLHTVFHCTMYTERKLEVYFKSSNEDFHSRSKLDEFSSSTFIDFLHVIKDVSL